MSNVYSKLALSFALGTGLALGAVGTAGPAHAVKKGGILNFVVGSKIPSYDLHRETTSAKGAFPRARMGSKSIPSRSARV